MKRIFMALLLMAAALSPATYAAAQATNWKDIPIPPLRSFQPKQPKRVQLSNGMVIFLQEDHELPLIDGNARIRGGSVNEQASKVGLVDIYSEVWRTGGTKSQTGDQLDDFLEVRAAKVETGGGPDSTTISFSCLKGDLDDVFKAFVDVLQNPEFRDDKIDIAKKGEIKNAIDDVVAMAKYPNVSVKLSSAPTYSFEPYPWRDMTEHLKRCFDAFGPQRCYWGTDITNALTKSTYRQRITHFTEELDFLSNEDKEWVMGRAILKRLGWS